MAMKNHYKAASTTTTRCRFFASHRSYSTGVSAGDYSAPMLRSPRTAPRCQTSNLPPPPTLHHLHPRNPGNNTRRHKKKKKIAVYYDRNIHRREACPDCAQPVLCSRRIGCRWPIAACPCRADGQPPSPLCSSPPPRCLRRPRGRPPGPKPGRAGSPRRTRPRSQRCICMIVGYLLCCEGGSDWLMHAFVSGFFGPGSS